MVTTDLGACEWFVWDLRRSNLLDRGQLDQVVGEFLEKNPRAEPPALAEYLVKRELLTQFQAERLLQGKTQGFVLGPFTLMDALGAGSMGTVYKALSKNDNRWYAVKVLPRRSMWNVRIARRKVRAFEQCKHPTVVPFVDVGTAGGMHYLAWSLVEGETLDKVVARQSRLAPSEAARIALNVAQGLEVCHAQSLFHGLLKPSNLMIGGDGAVHILDFGIGSLLAETEGESLVDTMSTANSVASGLDCASPESVMDPNNLTPAGDQYSLGCVLYFCLTGTYPFPDGTAAEKMMAIQIKQPVPVRELAPETPGELAAIVDRLMQKAPEARYSTTGELIAALQPLAASAPPAPPVARPGPSRSQQGTMTRAAAVQAEPPARASARPAPAPQRPISDPPLPTRQSIRAPAPAAPARPAPPTPPPPQRRSQTGTQARPAPAAAAQPEPAAPAPRPTLAMPELPPLTWEERLGPIGIAICAIVVCALAWLLTWKLF